MIRGVPHLNMLLCLAGVAPQLIGATHLAYKNTKGDRLVAFSISPTYGR